MWNCYMFLFDQLLNNTIQSETEYSVEVYSDPFKEAILWALILKNCMKLYRV